MKRFTKIVLFTASMAAGLGIGCGGLDEGGSGSVTTAPCQVVSPLRAGGHRQATTTPSAGA